MKSVIKGLTVFFALFALLNQSAFGQDLESMSAARITIQTAQRGIPSAVLEWEQPQLFVNAEGTYEFVGKSPVPFTGLTVGWQALDRTSNPADFQIEIRTLPTKGIWSVLHTTGETAPDETPSDLFWSHLYVTADGGVHTDYEVRMQTPPNVSLSFVRISVADASAGLIVSRFLGEQIPERVDPSITSFPQPSVIPRSDWWGGLPSGEIDSPRWSPIAITISHAVVHHTVDYNNPVNPAQIVRQIWDNHANTQGWGDIGYNFLIDHFGNIYQGRCNPWLSTTDVRAAHAGGGGGGANAVSVGVALIGQFHPPLTDPPAGMPDSRALRSAENLIAWRFDQRNLDPLGTANIITYWGTLNLDRITGHRNIGVLSGYTDCPGDNLYNLLPTIRANVKNLLAPTVGITFTTSPPGLQVLVDGYLYTTPIVFDWECGQIHVVTATSPQNGASGTQYLFNSWSDGQPQTHTITTPCANTTFSANYATQHYLTMNAGSGGTVSPSSGWYAHGQNVPIMASPSSEYTFVGWSGIGSGSYTGSSASASVTMNEPITETASFSPATLPRTLTVESSNPNSGVDIVVSPNDNNGQSNGTTQFTRAYNNGVQVRLEAPYTASGNTFQKWLRNGEFWSNGQITFVTMDDHHTMTVTYTSTVNEPFTDISAPLTGVGGSSVAWGDYDNDEDLDILLTGQTASGNAYAKIYRNDSSNFVELSVSIPGVYNGSVSWGDFDNDADLDILLTGFAGSENISKVFRNDSGTFTPMQSSLIGVAQSSAAWGDYDNDGDLDILLTGSTGSAMVSKVYRNDGGAFTDISASLIAVQASSVAWGDCDNDGDLDILLTGQTNSGNISKVYRNTDGVFSDISAPLTAVANSSVAWGDYDQDGDLDILLTGHTGSTRVAKVYRNDAVSFQDISVSLPGVSNGSIAWGDCDNDGDLDILLTGYNSTLGWISRVYANSTGSFIEITTSLSGVSTSSVAWGDYDSDRDLDILMAGWTGSDYIAKLYRNNTGTANTVPTAPSGITSSVVGNTVTLSWNKATDSQMAQNALTYNLRLGTTAGGVQKLSPMATVATGYRLVPKLGNTNHRNSWTVKNLPPGTYYWSVQAIDNAFAGSAFAPEQSFSVASSEIFTDISATLPDVSYSSVAWGDYDNDGDLDILLAGRPGSGQRIAKIFRNDGGVFVDIGAALEGVLETGEHALAWGDYDNDGDLDILLTGSGCGSGCISGDIPTTKIFRNDNGDFIATNSSLTPVRNSAVAWGDFDNDGDLDVLLTGHTGEGAISKVYRNDGNEVFADMNVSLQGVTDGCVAWGDFDNDGDLDILLTGHASPDGPISKVFRNDGNGVFANINASLQGVGGGSAAWGDYDSDGDLDVLLTGVTSSSTISKVYRNDGESFIDINASLSIVIHGSVAWGDYDNDGDLDILLAGDSYAGGIITKVYRNDSGNFVAIPASLTGVYYGSVAWGDYNNDGKLDILLSGETSSGYVSRLYRNNIGTANTAPTAPASLTSSVSGNSITLSWNKATDSQTAPNSLTYNLRLGKTAGGVERVAPMANVSTGYRRVPKLGNTNHRNGWTIKNLPSGTYYWSIQAIDNAFAGSAFAVEKSFTINPPVKWTARYNGPGNADDGAEALVVDNSGNVYVTGSSYGSNGSNDYATVKYNSSGTKQWIARFNVQGNRADEAKSLAVDGSGNVYVTGSSVGATGTYDYLTVKYNSAGVQQWTTRYNGPGSGDDKTNALVIDGSANVYVTGHSYGSTGSSDYATIKYNSAGTRQWVARYNAPGNNTDEAKAIAVDDGGNVYVTGHSFGANGTYDYFTVKYNGVGAQQWTARYNGSGSADDKAAALTVDGSGNAYVTGYSLGANGSNDIATVKYSNSGVKQWVARYNANGNNHDEAKALAIDNSGNVYVTGLSFGANGTYDCVTVKYSSAGAQQWAARYNGGGNGDDVANAIVLDALGNAYVTGKSFGSGGSYDYATVKYSSGGVRLWVMRYNPPANNDDEAKAIAVDGSGNVYVTGSSYGANGFKDYATIKYHESGANLPFADSTFVDDLELSKGDGEDQAYAEQQEPPDSYGLEPNFPNPFNPLTTIRFELPVATEVSLKIYNLKGELIQSLLNKRLPAGFHESKFDGSHLASGVYFYHLEAGPFTATRKMVLAK